MKTFQINFSAAIFAVLTTLAAICCFYACQKEQSGLSDINQQTTFFSEGKFKKILEASDVSGKNKIVFEVSANSEAVLATFDQNTFEAVPYAGLPDDGAANSGMVTEDNDDTVAENPTEAETDDNRYAVKILSSKTETGVKGLELRFTETSDAQENAAGERACPQLFGYYTNGTSTLGAVNYSPNCSKIIKLQFFRFNQGNPIAFQAANVWWELYASLPGSACYTNGPCCPLNLTNGYSKLTRELGTNNAGVSKTVRYTFKSLNNESVGMKMVGGTCQGNYLGVFIFI